MIDMVKPTKQSKVKNIPIVKPPKKIKPPKRKHLKEKAKYLEYYTINPVQRHAAAYIHRTEDCIMIWRKEDPIFSEQIATAKSNWAKGLVLKVKSPEWLLERLDRDSYGEKTDPNANSAIDKFFDRISKMFPD